MFLVTSSSVIAVDAPPTIGNNILKGIRTVTDRPISHLVYSHAHADHIGGAYLLNGPNVKIIAHQDTMTELAQVNDSSRPAPTITFSNDYTLQVSNQTLDLSYKGLNHEPGNIFIYAPVQKVLMLVDIVFPGWGPFANLGEAENVPGYILAHAQALAYPFTTYIGGHLNRVGTREDVMIAQKYVLSLRDNCANAIRLSAASPNATNPLSAQTALAGVEAADPGNSWALFGYYLNNVVGPYCADKTNAPYKGVLAGVDVFGLENAVLMIESLRIDYGLLGPYGVTN